MRGGQWKRVGWNGYWTGGWPVVGSVKGRPVVAGWCGEEDQASFFSGHVTADLDALFLITG